MLSDGDLEKFDQKAVQRVDEAVEFADNSPFPDLDSLYDDIYVYGDQVRGWYSVDERSPEPHPGEHERESGSVAHDLAEAGAAYASVGDAQQRRRQQHAEDAEEDVDEGGGEGEPAADDRDQEGGAD